MALHYGPNALASGRKTSHCVATTKLARKIKCAAQAVAVEPQAPPAPAASKTKKGYKDAIALQAFAWDSTSKENHYETIKSKIPEIKSAGITHVWLPPPSQSVSNEGYMPGQLYNLNSKYGNKEQLIALTSALKKAGLTPIADIVINHRCADEQTDGVWNQYRDDTDHRGRKVNWGKWAITGNDPHFRGTGNKDTGDDYEPAPDLDHLNPELQEALKDWLSWLQTEIGFEGWRFDYVKGYGPEFIKLYVEATVGGEVLNVGELWPDLKWNGPDLDLNQDGPRQLLVNWVKGTGETSTAFDFPLKGILQEAVKNTQYNRLKDAEGRAPGLIGILPGKAVTFVENHDTGSTQGHWPFPTKEVTSGNAYILTHPGVPCVFWDHLVSWGDEVKNAILDLIKVRTRNGIHAESKLNILTAEPDLYLASIDDKVILKLGPRSDLGSSTPKAEEGWSEAVSGHNFTVWEKKSQ